MQRNKAARGETNAKQAEDETSILPTWARVWRRIQVEKLLLECLTDDQGRAATWGKAQREFQRAA